MSTVSGAVGGVDTHADVHVAAAVDRNGGVLGIESFPADAGGYETLVGWLVGFGAVLRIGVEGTGSYGVGLSRFLHDLDVDVVEVDRPNRQARRRLGKPDPVDAVAAARAALSGSARVTPKRRDGPVEQIRVLLVARRSARQQRIATLNQLRQISIANRLRDETRPMRVPDVPRHRIRDGRDHRNALLRKGFRPWVVTDSNRRPLPCQCVSRGFCDLRIRPETCPDRG